MQTASSRECPPEGCVKVQVMSNRLEETVGRATECLENITDANNGLLRTLERVTTLLDTHAERFKDGNARFDKIDQAMQNLSTDVTTLKANSPSNGQNTTIATTISTVIATAAVGVIEWLRTH